MSSFNTINKMVHGRYLLLCTIISLRNLKEHVNYLKSKCKTLVAGRFFFFLNYKHKIKGRLLKITNHMELREKSCLNHGRSIKALPLLNSNVLCSGQFFANIIVNSFFHFPSFNILFSIVSFKMVVVFLSQYTTYKKKLTRFIEGSERAFISSFLMECDKK